MQEKRARLKVRYRRRPLRLSKVLCLEETEAEAVLSEAPVSKRRLPTQNLKGYRRADRRTRRTCYRACSREFGHRLERLPKAQRVLLLCRFRDGLAWKEACKKTGYSESGAMKILRRFKKA